MAFASIKYALISAIVMASMNGTNGLFLTQVVGVPDIITLLVNITDTSTMTSAFLPQLAGLLKSQENLQSLTTLILQNNTNTCRMLDEKMATQQQDMLRDQQTENNVTTDVLTGIAASLNQLAETQSELLVAQSRMGDVLERIADTQSRVADTQSRMADTQSRMADSLAEVVDLLQLESQPSQTMTPTKTNVVGQHSTQHPVTSVHPIDIPKDCSDLALTGHSSSGSYTIQPRDDLESFRAYCDMDTDNGGWTVFNKRFDGSVDFFLGWDAYEDGFGNPDAEHWLGLRNLHRLTRQGSWTLRVDLEDFQGNTAHAVYDSFSVGNAASFYRLSIGAYSGTAGDSLAYHNNKMFSTKDSDHDSRGRNCAQVWQGAWWYGGCAHSNLNGPYLGESQVTSTGMTWFHWKDSWEVLKRAEMKIRRVG